MFRKVFFQIYRVLHSLWAYAQQLTGEPPQKPLILEHRSSIHAACCFGSIRRAKTCKL